MEPAVQEKFEYLESVLGQFIVQTNTSLSRLEKNISALSMELREQEKEPDTISFLSKNNILALGMKDENMDLLNPDVCQYLLRPQSNGE
jgi:hypothetical protein